MHRAREGPPNREARGSCPSYCVATCVLADDRGERGARVERDGLSGLDDHDLSLPGLVLALAGLAVVVTALVEVGDGRSHGALAKSARTGLTDGSGRIHRR